MQTRAAQESREYPRKIWSYLSYHVNSKVVHTYTRTYGTARHYIPALLTGGGG